MTLHPATGPRPGRHYLSVDLDALHWGWIPTAGARPALWVDSGDTVTIDTVSHEGILGDQGRDPVAFFAEHGIGADDVLRDAVEVAGSAHPHDQSVDGPHVLIGPVAVRGAQPGDVIEVEMLELVPRVDYGIVSNRHGRGALAGAMPVVDARTGEAPAVVSVLGRVAHGPAGPYGTLDPWVEGAPAPRFPLRPFVGLVAVALEDPTPIHSTEPGDHGGNLDVKDLGAGTSLLCPVQVEGGLVSLGDPHFAQGNGEVALTAFEAPLRVTARFTLHRGDGITRLAELIRRPFGDTGEHLVIAGLGADLDGALRDACQRAVGVLGGRWGLDAQTALAYLSAAADFDVSQVVNGVKGIHCKIRWADLAHLGDDGIDEGRGGLDEGRGGGAGAAGGAGSPLEAGGDDSQA